MGRVVSVAMMVASLADLSARSLPGIEECPEIQWIKIDNEMERLELWMEKVRGCDDMRAFHKDLLSL